MEVIESSMWLDGTETVEQRARFEADVQESIAEYQADNGVVCGPLLWEEKRPLEPRVPPVPGHISGPDVRLLIGAASIIAVIPVESWFAADLEPDDLRRLRRITRRAYHARYPSRLRLTDRQCNTLINDLGPEAALDTLRADTLDVDTILH